MSTDDQDAIAYPPIFHMPKEDVTETLLQIDSGYFCAGIVLRNGRAIDGPPIIHYMLSNSWDEEKIRGYCLKKGWKAGEVKELGIDV